LKLVIIEGAGKKETIEKHLGKGYRVFATKGHIRDLPVNSLAVNVKKNFEPKYTIMEDKLDIVEKLKSEAKKCDGVLLATDPDREGEAISWHVAHILDIDPAEPLRIVFNEISKKAITAAVENPRAVDQSLVDAQQARRVLDRLVGYKLSPVLCKKIQNKLSAGRVQSVTLKLVVEREREIRNFKPEEYWPFFSMLAKKDSPLPIKATLEKRDGKKIKLTSKEEVDQVLSILDGKAYTVSSVKKSITKTRPVAPFITSSLQQDALNKLGFSLKQTSQIAQGLYEGVEAGSEGKIALVTYIRTDSTRVAPDAIASARSFIAKQFGEKYVPEKPNFYASKKGAQDAHEAIRPISIERTPESLKGILPNQHYKLYKLIYERFLASQMSDAQYNSLSVEIAADCFGFKVTGKTPLFAGYTAVYSMYEGDKKEEDESSANVKLPDLIEGEVLDFKEYKFEQKFTKPPARYTEASLVKAMEEKGIGRPATYTPTITVLTSRSYVSKEGKQLTPTDLGEKVTDMLVKYFPDIINVSFTASMEEELDKIEDGGMVWQSVIAQFYEGFEEKIATAVGDGFSLKTPDIKTEIECDKCGNMMVIKHGRFGQFLACPGFPKCRNTKQIEPSGEAASSAVTNVSNQSATATHDGEAPPPESDSMGNFEAAGAQPVATVTVKVLESTGIMCDKCGKEMVLKNGKFGPFYACPGYPDCRNIKSVEQKEDFPIGNCPKCEKPLKKITARGKAFYGCSGYPDCSFASSNPLLDEKCPDCGSHTVRKVLSDGIYGACGAKGCKHKKKIADKDSTEDSTQQG